MDINQKYNFKKYQKYKKKYIVMKKIFDKVGGSFIKYKKTIDDYLKKPNNFTLKEISTIKDKLTIELLIKYLDKQKDLSNEKYDVNLSLYSSRIDFLIKELKEQKRKIDEENKSQEVDDKLPTTVIIKKVDPTSSVTSNKEKKAETIKLGLSSSGATGKETKEEIKKIRMYEKFKNKLASKFYLWFYKKKKDGKITTKDDIVPEPIFFEPKNIIEEKTSRNLLDSLPEDSIERYSSIIIPFDWYEKYDFYVNSEDGINSWFKV